MPARKELNNSILSVSSYTFPKLHVGKKWFIDFLCFDPVSGLMKRKKYHLDGIKKLSDRRAYARVLIANISERLRRGWNVWATQAENTRMFTLYSDMCTLYVRYIERLAASNSIKKSTELSYISYLNIFNEYVSKSVVHKVVYAYQVNVELLSDFLDYMLLDREVSARTRNNYLVFLSVFCGWMVARGYLKENPASKIKSIKVNPKKREQFSPEKLSELERYLEARNKHYLLACMMEYYTFIRPEELVHVRIGDISVKDQKILLSGSFTKNRKDGAVALNETLIKMMVELEVFKHPSDDYLFSNHKFLPGPTQLFSRAFRDAFVKLRKVLKWPDCYQFYSLKDTGIRDLANAEGIVVARDQARHSDISTTNKYLKGSSLTVHEETKHFKGGL